MKADSSLVLYDAERDRVGILIYLLNTASGMQVPGHLATVNH
jgi:hypothetical protein